MAHQHETILHDDRMQRWRIQKMHNADYSDANRISMINESMAATNWMGARVISIIWIRWIVKSDARQRYAVNRKFHGMSWPSKRTIDAKVAHRCRLIIKTYAHFRYCKTRFIENRKLTQDTFILFGSLLIWRRKCALCSSFFPCIRCNGI